MAAINDPAQELYGKLQLLLKKYQQLQKDHLRLQAEVDQLRTGKATAEHRLEELSLQVSVLRSAAGQLGEEEKKAFSRKLNRFIKDIDHCITLLSE